MAAEETFRREFQKRVEEAIDAESARFLMAHLPPVPWPEVATKHDLELFEARFDLMDERLAKGLAEQEAKLALLVTNQTRTIIIALIGAVVSIASLGLFR